MKKGNFFIILGVLLLLGALGFTGYNLYTDYEAKVAADEAVEALAADIFGDGQTDGDSGETQQNGADSAVDAADTEAAVDSEDDPAIPLWQQNPDMDMPTVTIDGYKYIGILEIPSRDLKLPVMEEWDYTRLKVAPCRYSGSVYQDNMVICGHNYSGHFSEVRYIGIGEEVIFTDVDGNVFRYIVDNVETLSPTQVEDMTTGDWDLTLFTCNTGARTRRAVRCYREKD